MWQLKSMEIKYVTLQTLLKKIKLQLSSGNISHIFLTIPQSKFEYASMFKIPICAIYNMHFYMLSQCPDSYVSLKGTGFLPLLLPPSLWKKTRENLPVNQHDHMQWYFQENLRRKAFLFHSINLSSWPAFRLWVACTTLMLILLQTSSFMKAIFYLFGSLQSHESWKRNISTTHIL